MGPKETNFLTFILTTSNMTVQVSDPWEKSKSLHFFFDPSLLYYALKLSRSQRIIIE